MRKFTLMISAFALSFILFSCQKNGNPMGSEGDIDFGSDPITSTMLPDETMDNINSVDLSIPFSTEDADYTYDDIFMSPGDRGHRNPNDRRRPKDDLGLTDEQKAAMEQARLDYIDCSKEYRTKLMEIQRAVFEAANAERMDIINKVRSGEIDRKTAYDMLKSLREKTKTSLEENADYQAALAGLKGCQETLKSTIDSILTDAQKDLLKKRQEEHKNLRKDRRPNRR